MASTLNAYAALGAIGSGAAPSAKKKKAAKAKAKPAAAQEDAPVADAAPDDAVVEVGEACAILDKTSRTFKSGSDRLKLWKDWMKQVGPAGGLGRGQGESDQTPNRSPRLAASSRPWIAAPRPSATPTWTAPAWTSRRCSGGGPVAAPVAARAGERPFGV